MPMDPLPIITMLAECIRAVLISAVLSLLAAAGALLLAKLSGGSHRGKNSSMASGQH